MVAYAYVYIYFYGDCGSFYAKDGTPKYFCKHDNEMVLTGVEEV